LDHAPGQAKASLTEDRDRPEILRLVGLEVTPAIVSAGHTITFDTACGKSANPVLCAPVGVNSIFGASLLHIETHRQALTIGLPPRLGRGS
jgi:hypothetical protein